MDRVGTSGRHPLPHDATAPGRARRIVDRVGRGMPASVVQTAQLLVSELVTNAVRHTEPTSEGAIDVSIRPDGERLHVEVRDAGHAIEAGRSNGTPSLGFGLRLVEGLASDWGTEITGAGRTVWFEVAD